MVPSSALFIYSFGARLSCRIVFFICLRWNRAIDLSLNFVKIVIVGDLPTNCLCQILKEPLRCNEFIHIVIDKFSSCVMLKSLN